MEELGQQCGMLFLHHLLCWAGRVGGGHSLMEAVGPKAAPGHPDAMSALWASAFTAINCVCLEVGVVR